MMSTHKEIPSIAQIEAFCHKKNFKKAKRLTHRRLAFDLHDAAAWEMLGLILYSTKHYKASVEALLKSDSIKPLSLTGKISLSRSYASSNETEKAVEILRDVSQNIFSDTALLLKLASAWDCVDMPVESMKLCREAILQDSLLSQAYYDLAYYAGRCGYKFRLIESLARKAISISPNDPNYRLGLAVMLVEQNKDQAAYDLVRQFSEEQVSSLNCACCLERLVDLFDYFNDYSQAAICKSHLLEVKLRSVE